MFEDSIITRQPATVVRDDFNFVFSGRPSGAAIWYWLHGNNTQGYVPSTTQKKNSVWSLNLEGCKRHTLARRSGRGRHDDDDDELVGIPFYRADKTAINFWEDRLQSTSTLYHKRVFRWEIGLSLFKPETPTGDKKGKAQAHSSPFHF
jgi:hypothetical protein